MPTKVQSSNGGRHGYVRHGDGHVRKSRGNLAPRKVVDSALPPLLIVGLQKAHPHLGGLVKGTVCARCVEVDASRHGKGR